MSYCLTVTRRGLMQPSRSLKVLCQTMKFGLSLTTWLSAGSLVEMCGKRRLYFNASSRKTLGSNRYKESLRMQKIVPPAKNRNGSKTLTTKQIANLAMEERMLRVIASASKDKPSPTSTGKKPNE